ncbi:hypothetical protein PHPALM_31011 [Phytophthora palmivora]|uniref:Integrase zinc-binding domain-containing protein n=1 Tax=Phytophthora palmivora TaxID=4796 RepID=A0A2P4X3Q2_9STRA|nr:hypothetical protein PHPALM_31011 [Phytophthora palmivora]
MLDNKVWIPPTAVDLMERICVVGHAGSRGHRGQKATLESIKAWCWWETLAKDVQTFVSSLGPALHATKPNEALHFDYLSMPEDEDTQNKYILVIKDDFSGFVELIPGKAADAETCAQGQVEWFARFWSGDYLGIRAKAFYTLRWEPPHRIKVAVDFIFEFATQT